MQITKLKLAALVAGTAILTAGLTAFYAPEPVPAATAQELPTITVTKYGIGCATLEHLQAIGIIANKGSAETFSQAVDYAQASGKCQALPPGTRISIVQADPVYTDLVTQDGRRLLAYTDTLGEAE